MTCPICKSDLYEKDRRNITGGTFIAIRCSNPNCGYFDNTSNKFIWNRYNDCELI